MDLKNKISFHTKNLIDIQAKEYIQTSSCKVSFKYKNKVKIW